MPQMIEVEKTLLERISNKREKMIQYASRWELTDHRVVKCSQELDELLNRLDRHSHHKS
jgi:hypothetical protein